MFICADAATAIRTMRILILLVAFNHHVTLIIRYFIHFYYGTCILCVDDTSDVLRNHSGENLSLGLDVAEKPSTVHSLGKQLNGATGSKRKRKASSNVEDLGEL